MTAGLPGINGAVLVSHSLSSLLCCLADSPNTGFSVHLVCGKLVLGYTGQQGNAMGSLGKPSAIVSRTDAATQAAWEALPISLRECGEIASQRLCGILSAALRQAEELLFSASTQALTEAECEALLGAGEFARARRDGLVADFRKHFEQRYVRACQYKPRTITSYRIDFDASQLEIVQHDLLDDSLDPGMIGEAIQNTSWSSLHQLTLCFAKLLGAESIKPTDIPLSPSLIEASVSDAMRDQAWRHDAKYRLMRSLRRFLPERVGHLYRDLAEHLNPGKRQVDVIDVADSTFLDDQPAMPLAVINAEMSWDQINIAPSNEAVEFALPAASDAAVENQVRMQSPHDPSEIVDLPAKPHVVFEPADQAEPLENIQPKQQVMPPTRQAQIAMMLAGLEIGAWLEFREANGNLKELKLAWISPRKSLYLMINRQGERALSMSSVDFAAALLDGRARIVMHREPSTPACAVAGNHTKKMA